VVHPARRICERSQPSSVGNYVPTATGVILMLKFLGSTVGIIFLIGLLVVIGLFMLVF
jgi:uncharacterized membrane protein YecN with MAPEG domain